LGVHHHAGVGAERQVSSPHDRLSSPLGVHPLALLLGKTVVSGADEYGFWVDVIVERSSGRRPTGDRPGGRGESGRAGALIVTPNKRDA